MIRAKVSLQGVGSAPSLSQFVGRGSSNSSVEFYINDPTCTDADVWLVLEQPPNDDLFCRVPQDKVAYLGAETSFGSQYWNRYRNRRKYLAQFAEVHSWLPIHHPALKRSLPYLPWMINSNHGDTIFADHVRDADWLRSSRPEKSRLVSVFCSNKTFTPGHRQRLHFVEMLAAELGDELDWFGNGIRSVPEKWEGLAPYRYAIVLENQSMPSLITEKLYDAYLALAHPIYWGAPDVDTFFPKDSLATIDLSNPRKAVDAVKAIVETDRDRKMRESLLTAREMVINEYNLATRLATLAERLMDRGGTTSADVTLEPLSADPGFARQLSRGKHFVKSLVT